MALTNGPRLGWPSNAGFKVWARFDGANSIALETKLPTESTWTVQETLTADAAKSNTVVLEATGLNAATKYDYRLKEDGVVVHTAYTYTMPTSGRFVVYHVSDAHDSVGGMEAAVRSHWEAEYEPSGIPAVVIHTGDLFLLTATEDTKASAVTKALTAIDEISGTGQVAERLPFLYMWDDWDFGGNNSAGGSLGDGTRLSDAFSSEVDPTQAALDVWDWLWRDHVQAAAPSTAWLNVIAGVPIAALDARSQYTAHGSYVIPSDPTNANYGTALSDAEAPMLGAAQTTWAKGLFSTYSDRGLMILISPCTLSSYLESTGQVYTGGFDTVKRDGMNFYGRGTINDLFTEATRFGWGVGGRRLVIFSGDDHYTAIWRGHAAVAGGRYDADVTGGTLPFAAHPVPFIEEKTKSGISVGSLFLHAIDTAGDEGYWSENPYRDGSVPASRTGSFIVWDITSTHSGQRVTARVRVYAETDVVTPRTDVSGRLADFYFAHGRLTSFVASGQVDLSGSAEQTYPPDNGPRPGVRFQRAYLDDRTGALHYENDLTRDRDERLRETRDTGRPDRDHILETWEWPDEGNDPEPLE